MSFEVLPTPTILYFCGLGCSFSPCAQLAPVPGQWEPLGELGLLMVQGKPGATPPSKTKAGMNNFALSVSLRDGFIFSAHPHSLSGVFIHFYH